MKVKLPNGLAYANSSTFLFRINQIMHDLEEGHFVGFDISSLQTRVIIIHIDVRPGQI